MNAASTPGSPRISCSAAPFTNCCVGCRVRMFRVKRALGTGDLDSSSTACASAVCIS